MCHVCTLESTLESTKRELDEYRKERQEFIDRDNAAQDDAARIAKAEYRVRELESLELVAMFTHTNQTVRLVVVVPLSRYKEDADTLGEAMPGGGK
jgi:cell fate (sporulation/competence/biofilm development) regulator YlbF (YheA/YmcA/DUF963 family)